MTEIYLGERGSTPGVTPQDLEGHELVHALHARKAGVSVRKAAEALHLPYVVSVTGTDVHQDLGDPDRAPTVLEVLRGAAAVLVPEPGVATTIAHLGLAVPCVEIPKAVEDPDAWGSPPAERGDDILLLHVAGWRDVKNQLFVLEPLARVAAEVPGLRLRFIGPVLDARYHAEWSRLAPGFPFATEGGPVDPMRMQREYASASVTLNTSHSEGAANSVLESMATGRVVLASDVPGNAALVRFLPSRWEDSTGVLYRTMPGVDGRRIHDADDFLAKARRLVLDRRLRERMGENARRVALAEHRPEREISAVLEAYRLALP